MSPGETNSIDNFEKRKADFGIVYVNEENNFRQMIFEQNIAKINEHNAYENQTYKMVVNQFTELTKRCLFKRISVPPSSVCLKIQYWGHAAQTWE